MSAQSYRRGDDELHEAANTALRRALDGMNNLNGDSPFATKFLEEVKATGGDFLVEKVQSYRALPDPGPRNLPSMQLLVDGEVTAVAAPPLSDNVRTMSRILSHGVLVDISPPKKDECQHVHEPVEVFKVRTTEDNDSWISAPTLSRLLSTRREQDVMIPFFIGCLESALKTVFKNQGHQGVKEFGLGMLRHRNDGHNPDEARCVQFVGPPGSGKSTAASTLSLLGYLTGDLACGHVVTVDATNLYGACVGQASDNVVRYVTCARGGVLFIDEFHQLGNPKSIEEGYAKSVVDASVPFMAKRDPQFIAAGYGQGFQKAFDNMDEGVPSRFVYKVVFEPFSSDVLMTIFDENLKKKDNLCLSDDARALVQRSMDFGIKEDETRTPPKVTSRSVMGLASQLSGSCSVQRKGEARSVSTDEVWKCCQQSFGIDEIPSWDLTKDAFPESVPTNDHMEKICSQQYDDGMWCSAHVREGMCASSKG